MYIKCDSLDEGIVHNGITIHCTGVKYLQFCMYVYVYVRHTYLCTVIHSLILHHICALSVIEINSGSDLCYNDETVNFNINSVENRKTF